MGRLRFWVFVFFVGIGVGHVQAAKVALFGSNGKPVAYIDQDQCLCLWSGQVIGYLEPTREGEFNLYGTGGGHVGWYVHGVIRDHEGLSVGAYKDRFSPLLPTEPPVTKALARPKRAEQQPAPPEPMFSGRWSKMSLETFLSMTEGC